MTKKRIVIVGMGFGGVRAARVLAGGGACKSVSTDGAEEVVI